MNESHSRSLAFLLDAKRERNFHAAFDRAFVAQMKDGASRMLSVAGVRRLAGCGLGLTPSGDDFIAGMLIGLNVLQRLTAPNRRGLIRRLHSAAKSQNLLSSSFLALARVGRVTEHVQAFVSALSRHGNTELHRRARRAMAAGETSGADLLTGFVMTVKTGVLGWRSAGALEKGAVCSSHRSITPVLHYSMVSEDIP